jgi:hypothetical protein
MCLSALDVMCLGIIFNIITFDEGWMCTLRVCVIDITAHIQSITSAHYLGVSQLLYNFVPV